MTFAYRQMDAFCDVTTVSDSDVLEHPGRVFSLTSCLRKHSVPRRVGNDRLVFGLFLSFMSSLCFIKKILEIGLWALI